jgi:hypothetical protein
MKGNKKKEQSIDVAMSSRVRVKVIGKVFWRAVDDCDSVVKRVRKMMINCDVWFLKWKSETGEKDAGVLRSNLADRTDGGGLSFDIGS